jgi:GT2 family glycosyltransferase
MRPRSIAYVLVAYRNEPTEIRELTQSLLQPTIEAGFNATVYLVANDSFLYEESDAVKVISGQGNVGFARGVEIGVRAASEDYVICVNPDCQITAQDLSVFLDAASIDRQIQVPILNDAAGNFDYLPYEYWTYTPTRLINARRCSKLLAEVESTSTRVELPRYAKISGAFIGLSRQLAMELDAPFSTDFYLYAEDRDLTRRVRGLGIPIWLNLSCSVLHEGGVSGRSVSNIVAMSKTDGSLRFAYRRYGRAGAALYALDELTVDCIKRMLGRSVHRTPRKVAAARWLEARFSDPGPLNEELLAQLSVDAGAKQTRREAGAASGTQ